MSIVREKLSQDFALGVLYGILKDAWMLGYKQRYIPDKDINLLCIEDITNYLNGEKVTRKETHFKEEPLRQTGRTSRMIAKAIEDDTTARKVIVFNSHTECNLFKSQFNIPSNIFVYPVDRAIELELIDPATYLPTVVSHGFYKVYVDHSVIERMYKRIADIILEGV